LGTPCFSALPTKQVISVMAGFSVANSNGMTGLGALQSGSFQLASGWCRRKATFPAPHWNAVDWSIPGIRPRKNG
jgi:hypothetical protein